jgi:hypothetical protein
VGRHSTEVAFKLLNQPARFRFSVRAFPRKEEMFILDVAVRFINIQLKMHCFALVDSANMEV